jgi:hypothetical protein
MQAGSVKGTVVIGLFGGWAIITCFGALAADDNPPLPPQRPPGLSRPAAPASVAPPAIPTPDAGARCLAALSVMQVEAVAAAGPIDQAAGCAIDNPVRLRRLQVRARKGVAITFADEPLIACRFALGYAEWIGEVVAPLIAGRLGADIRTIRTGPGFECRNVNRSASGKKSAHASGLAIDMDQILLADGRNLVVGDASAADAAAALLALRRSACGWFTTVLGPGSDAAHASHIHVDLQQHGRSDRYRICE